jgi:two-component system chemotaxis sensor kinase CheA
VRFSLATIDSALDELKAKARPHGEIITYLPTGSGGDIDTIELEILMASREPVDELRGRHHRAERGHRRGRRRAAPSGIPDTPRPCPAARLYESRRAADEGRGAPLPARARDRACACPASASGAPPAAPASPVRQPGGRRLAGRELSLRSVSQTVRVDIRKLDR